MDTVTQLHRPDPGRTRGRRTAALWGAAGMLLLVLVSRFVTSNLSVFSTVTQRSCQGGFCVERVHRPDLLFVPGVREVRVGHTGSADTTHGTEDTAVQGRIYLEHDPFYGSSDVSIVWRDGGVSLTDTAATLSWDAGTLARLDT